MITSKYEMVPQNEYRVFQRHSLLRAMRCMVVPLPSKGGDCCGPLGGACHH